MKEVNPENIVYSTGVILYWRVKVSYKCDKCDTLTGFYFVFPLHKK